MSTESAAARGAVDDTHRRARTTARPSPARGRTAFDRTVLGHAARGRATLGRTVRDRVALERNARGRAAPDPTALVRPPLGRIGFARAALCCAALGCLAPDASLAQSEAGPAAAGDTRLESPPPSDAASGGGAGAVEAPLFEDGGFLEIGVSAVAALSERARADSDDDGTAELGLAFLVSAGWRRGAFFVEGRRGGFDGANFGATLWQSRRSALDLLALHAVGNLSLFVEDDTGGESAADRRLLERDEVLATSGLRWRHYRGNVLAQAALALDWARGHGLLAGVHLGRQWQLGNWNAHAIGGLRHASSSLADALWGVDADEASARFAPYRAPATTFGELELGLSRPLARHWVFRSSLRGRVFDDAVTDSPLVAREGSTVLEAGVGYVF